MDYILTIIQADGLRYEREFVTFEAAKYHLEQFFDAASFKFPPILCFADCGTQASNVWMWDAEKEVFIQIF